MRFSITRTTGIAAAVTVLAGGGLATAAVANTHTIDAPVAVTMTGVPALTPAQVKYAHRSWGDPKTEVGIVVWAPANWRMVKLSTSRQSSSARTRCGICASTEASRRRIR